MHYKARIAKHVFPMHLTVADSQLPYIHKRQKMSIKGATHAHDLTFLACNSTPIMINLSTLCVSCAGCKHAHASAHSEHTVQEQYETLCKELFDELDKLEKRLDGQRYLIPYYPGGRANPCPTLADYRLFTTLIRFDIAYYPLFKSNLRHIRDYPNLQVNLLCQYWCPTAHGGTQLCFTWMLQGALHQAPDAVGSSNSSMQTAC